MTTQQVLLLLLLLQLKHLVIDWLWQTPYELANKGTYLHMGGQQHAVKHAFFSAVCFVFYTNPVSCFGVFFMDFLVHYHIDWAKVQLTQRTGWTASDPGFWWLTGVDQWCHQATYLALVWIFLL
jgi:hypothetical protein